jgi:cytochrome c556
MNKWTSILAGFAVTAALGVCFLAAASGRDDDPEKVKQEKMKKAAVVREPVLKLADAVTGKEDDAKKLAAEIAGKYDIEFVMWQFKPREDGGLGVSPDPNAPRPDNSVELKIIALSSTKTPVTAKALAAQKKDLVRMMHVTAAIALVAPNYAPKKDEPDKKIADWLKLSAAMKKGSQDLLDAINAENPESVQKTALRLSSTCDECHTKFRDN